MPMHRGDYPPNWEEIRGRILKRADHRCEFCKVPEYAIKANGTRVVLSIAHLDHDRENWAVQDERLACLCQACHLGYDRWRHVENLRYGRNFRKYQLLLFSADELRQQYRLLDPGKWSFNPPELRVDVTVQPYISQMELFNDSL